MMRSHKSLFLSVVWTALVLSLAAAVTPAHAFRMIQNTQIGRVTAGARVTCQDPGGFAHWNDHNIVWRLNTANQGSGKLAAMQAAMGSWNAVGGSDYNLTYGGTSSAGFATDGSNTALWANGNGCTGGCLALTALVLQAGQVIVETDVTFNNNVTWTTNGANFDTQSVMAHELGHSLGIHHTELTGTPRPTMFASYFGSGGRTLETDDQAALQCSVNRYPAAGGGNTDVEYRAHVAGFGWLGWVRNGATAGTTGQSRRMEAAQVRLLSAPGGMGICYRAHVAGLGWLGTVCNGGVAGTTGQSRRMEAITVNLTGAPAGCSVQYRAHVAGLGWLGWVSNGAVAGTTGQSRQMEAMQVRLINCP